MISLTTISPAQRRDGSRKTRPIKAAAMSQFCFAVIRGRSPPREWACVWRSGVAKIGFPGGFRADQQQRFIQQRRVSKFIKKDKRHWPITKELKTVRSHA